MNKKGGFYQGVTEKYGIVTTKDLKKWSRINIKLAKFNNRLIFTMECRRKEVIPTHIKNNIRSLDVMLTCEGKFLQTALNIKNKLVSKILTHEINVTNFYIRKMNKELDSLKNNVKNVLTEIEFREFSKKQKQKYHKLFYKVKSGNIKKIKNLGDKNKQNVLMGNQKWFVNATNVPIPQEIQGFLSLGPKFALKTSPRNFPISSYLAEIENITSEIHEENRNQFRARVTNIITNFIKNNNEKDQMSLERKTKRFLKEHSDILVIQADKGKKTVILNKQDYIFKAQELLQDRNTYKKIDRDQTRKIEKQHNDMVKLLESKKFIDKETTKKLTTRKSQAPKFYGLAKVHKQELPLRPIISTVNGPNQNLSKMVAEILKIAFREYNKFRILNTFSFAEAVNDIEVQRDHMIVSLDVISLFTNIPLELILSILENNWELIRQNCKMTKDIFFTIIRFLFDTTHFTFNGEHYMQIFGCPMGSALSPIVADIIMNDLLRTVLETLPFNPSFVYQYVDDLILTIPKDSLDITVEIFNNYNKHIKFTAETENERKGVPFLDTLVIRDKVGDAYKIKLDWYIKPTSSNRFLNYFSNHSLQQKINVVLGQKNRINNICHKEYRYENLKKLRDILLENNYPKSLLNNLLFNEQLSTKTKELPINEEVKHIGLMYNPKITPKIKELIKQVDTKKVIKVADKPIRLLNSFFSKLKDKTPDMEQSDVVYCIPCLDCNQKYIGQTSQILRYRINQHKSDCRVKPKACALSEHFNDKQHRINYDETKILRKESNNKIRMFLEMTEIQKHKDVAMNTKKDINQLSTIYTWLLNEEERERRGRTEDRIGIT